MKFKLQGRTTETVSENSVSELFRQVIHQYNRAEYLGLMDNTITELAGTLEDHLRGTPGWFLDLGSQSEKTQSEKNQSEMNQSGEELT
jgi:collagenase-like PrtC family protease